MDERKTHLEYVWWPEFDFAGNLIHREPDPPARYFKPMSREAQIEELDFLHSIGQSDEFEDAARYNDRQRQKSAKV